MVSLLQVQINIVLSILLIILLVHAFFNMNKKNIINRIFVWIIGVTSSTLILEIFSVLLNNPDLKQFMVLHKLVNIIGFIIAPSIPFLGFLFIKEWANRFQNEKIKLNKILLLPLFINGIGALITYNGGVLFRITSENIYERGPLFFVLPCVSYIYFGYNLFFIYKHSKKFTHSEVVIFSLFYIVPAIFAIIQLRYSVYLTTWNSIAIVIVAIYIFILNDQAYRDSMTGLENRLSYEKYAQNIDCKKLNNLSIMYIDLDEFKSINDQYGHLEGDEVIKAFANLLIESFLLRKNKLIRLGGDEFLILLEDQQPEQAEAYIQKLTQLVEAYNNKGEKAYRLKFSYGVAGYTNVQNNIYKILECADQLMYEQKHNRNGIYVS